MKTPQRFSKEQIQRLLGRLKGWKLKNKSLEKTYVFSGFIAAMVFVNHVANEAEALDHHPDILVQYKEVTLTVSTHSAGGLTEKDFALAQRIDQ